VNIETDNETRQGLEQLSIWERLSPSSGELDWLMREYSADSDYLARLLARLGGRAGRKAICERKTKKLEKLLAKYEEMREFDRCEGGRRRIFAGVDEAGRGPLAGPVVAACAIVPADFSLLGVDDSKKLTAGEREHLYSVIVRGGQVTFGIGIVSSRTIDRRNILEATRLAVVKAVNTMSSRPALLLTDALKIPALDIPQKAFVKGDSRSYAIATASILAKVTRDRILDSYDQKYPEYGFARHKGYGTSEHLEALSKFGPCPIHRMTFAPVSAVAIRKEAGQSWQIPKDHSDDSSRHER
jgi:ribonuclease HII